MPEAPAWGRVQAPTTVTAAVRRDLDEHQPISEFIINTDLSKIEFRALRTNLVYFGECV